MQKELLKFRGAVKLIHKEQRELRISKAICSCSSEGDFPNKMGVCERTAVPCNIDFRFAVFWLKIFKPNFDDLPSLYRFKDLD